MKSFFSRRDGMSSGLSIGRRTETSTGTEKASGS